jgi:TolA-binding protein
LNKQAEAQLSEASNKIAELQKELGDLASHKNRIQQENFDLVRRLEEAANQLDQANKGKLVLTKQLDELKLAVDDETTVRNKVSQCRFNHRPNGPVARTPSSKGPPS